MTKRNTSSTSKQVTLVMSAALCVCALILWEWLVRAKGISALVLPAPSSIALTLWQGLRSGYLWPHMLQTLAEWAAGLSLGCVLGFVGGLVLGEVALVRQIALPYIVTSQVVPKLALAPLFIVWFGFGALPTVVMTALICFFPLLENTMTAVSQADAQQLDLFRMLRASRWATLVQLKLPQGLPTVLTGLRMAVVLAWVGAVVGEFTTASKGLGALIIAAQGSMDTALMFAVLVLITALGWVSYQACGVFERFVLRQTGFLKR